MNTPRPAPLDEHQLVPVHPLKRYRSRSSGRLPRACDLAPMQLPGICHPNGVTNRSSGYRDVLPLMARRYLRLEPGYLTGLPFMGDWRGSTGRRLPTFDHWWPPWPAPAEAGTEARNPLTPKPNQGLPPRLCAHGEELHPRLEDDGVKPGADR